jgi:hypothetical protein
MASTPVVNVVSSKVTILDSPIPNSKPVVKIRFPTF